MQLLLGVLGHERMGVEVMSAIERGRDAAMTCGLWAVEESIVDHITDVLLWAESVDLDVDGILSSVHLHFSAECKEAQS